MNDMVLLPTTKEGTVMSLQNHIGMQVRCLYNAQGEFLDYALVILDPAIKVID